MEQTWEIIGIVLAVLMVIIGLRLLLKKPQPLPNVKMDDLTVENDSQQPIVPRAIRENLNTTDNRPLENLERAEQPVIHEQALEIAETVVAQKPLEHREKADEAALQVVQKELDEEQELIQEAKKLAITQDVPERDSDVLTTAKAEDLNTPKTELQALEFQDDDLLSEATVLDAHLSEQNRVDEESALATAQKIVALYMYPNPERALSGERTLKMLLKYGLRFGEMSCFHRYEHPEHPSSLMFSVLRIDNDGAPTGFDLEALPTDEVKGLAFFLALPSPNAVQGFDMMASIAGLIARDTEGLVFDEQSLELTQQLRDHWRHFVIEYNPEQAKHLD